jgi:hypothetical protein
MDLVDTKVARPPRRDENRRPERESGRPLNTAAYAPKGVGRGSIVKEHAGLRESGRNGTGRVISSGPLTMTARSL